MCIQELEARGEREKTRLCVCVCVSQSLYNVDQKKVCKYYFCMAGKDRTPTRRAFVCKMCIFLYRITPTCESGSATLSPPWDVIGHRGAAMDGILLTMIQDLSENDP